MSLKFRSVCGVLSPTFVIDCCFFPELRERERERERSGWGRWRGGKSSRSPLVGSRKYNVQIRPLLVSYTDIPQLL